MIAKGHFTGSDIRTIERAATLAESLTEQYFDLSRDEWAQCPYGIYTLKEVNQTLYRKDAFAQVIRYPRSAPNKHRIESAFAFGIVLQDPNILQALLRSEKPDLWTMGLYVLTHELVHIVRFRKFGIDFCSSTSQREHEERLVHGMTRDILAGVTNTDHVLSLYPKNEQIPDDLRSMRGGKHANIRV